MTRSSEKRTSSAAVENREHSGARKTALTGNSSAGPEDPGGGDKRKMTEAGTPRGGGDQGSKAASELVWYGTELRPSYSKSQEACPEEELAAQEALCWTDPIDCSQRPFMHQIVLKSLKRAFDTMPSHKLYIGEANETV